MAATYRTTAVILMRTDYREADRRLTIASRQRGVVTVVARGTRKVTSKLSGNLEPLILADLTLAVGRTHDVVMGSEVLAYHSALKADPRLVWLGSYVAEAVAAMLPAHQPDGKLFQALCDYLDCLDRQDISLESKRMTTDILLWKTIAVCGFLPEIFRCAVCRKPVSADGLAFAYIDGGIVDRRHNHPHHGHPIRSSTIALLRAALKAPLRTLDVGDWSDDALRETHETVLEGLTYHVDRPIQSSAFVADPQFQSA